MSRDVAINEVAFERVDRTDSSESRLLIVDDHPLSRQALHAAFRGRGYVCSVAGTAEAALSSIETFAPDIVLMEWAFRTPTPAAVGLAAELRARAAACGRSLFVVVVSHADQPPDFRVREDVDAYFTKPVAAHVIEASFGPTFRPR